MKRIIGILLIFVWVTLGFAILFELLTWQPYEQIPHEEPAEAVIIAEGAGIGRIMPETETAPLTNVEAAKMFVTATAYCPCLHCCGKTDGITATGTIATQGRTIAADPAVIPYGTAVIINGNTYIVEDCGGAIKGNRIDIFFDSHAEALEFGVQELALKICN